MQPAACLFPLVADFFQTFSWLLRENDIWEAIQKQPLIGVLIKRCSDVQVFFYAVAFLGSGILKKLLPFVVLPVVFVHLYS